MYESFYSLRTKPFSLLPDPEYLYLGKGHRVGLVLLEYGLQNRAVFTVLTGEPGTGKTTLVNRILEQAGERYRVGVVTTTHPSASSFLPWVADAFGLECAGGDTVGYFRTFIAFVGQAFAEGRQVLLVVDEAQNFNLQMLEDLRLLSNVNDRRQSGVQIILAGQPSLRSLLTRRDMRQLAQRVLVDYVLPPLAESETTAYVHHRLGVAGGSTHLFTEYACTLVHQLSGGIPRLINQLCDLALTYGFGEAADRITATLVLQAAVDRAQGGILQCAVDPKTIQLDPAALGRESQQGEATPVPTQGGRREESPPAPVPPREEDGTERSRPETIRVVSTPEREALKKVEVAGRGPAGLKRESQQIEGKTLPAQEDRREPSPPAPVPPREEDGKGRYRQGLGLKQAGLYREALKKFDLAGRDPALQFKVSAQRGLCLRAIGKLDEAAHSFRHALSANGANSSDVLHVKYVLGMTLDALGRNDKADAQYRQIYEADPTFRDIARRLDRESQSPPSWLESLKLRWQQFRGAPASRQ